MPHETYQQLTLPGVNPLETREVITERDTAYKVRAVDRDQETFDMVRAKDASDPKFSWAAEYINGKVRVTTRPRA